MQDKHLEVDKKDTNKNDINNTEFSITESNHIISVNDEIRRDDIGEYLLKNNVPIINLYSHKNYSDSFWNTCENNGFLL